MTNYRRADFPGGYYFFTLVTYDRRALFNEPLARECLRAAWAETREQMPFEDVALCLLPNHLHCVWKLPEGDADFSLRWARIKAGFTHRYLEAGGAESKQSASRHRKRERGIWQRRFWEHQIRDERDLQRHVDYTHYNPVKHGLVERIEDWPWSSYHRYAREALYPEQYWQAAQDGFQDLDVDDEATESAWAEAHPTKLPIPGATPRQGADHALDSTTLPHPNDLSAS